MARLIVSATAYGFLNGFEIVVSVSSNDGMAVTDLKSDNFKVYRLAAGSNVSPVPRAINSFQDFSEMSKALGNAPPLGFYGLGIAGETGTPSPGVHVFAVVVMRRPDRGQAIAEGVLPA